MEVSRIDLDRQLQPAPSRLLRHVQVSRIDLDRQLQLRYGPFKTTGEVSRIDLDRQLQQNSLLPCSSCQVSRIDLDRQLQHVAFQRGHASQVSRIDLDRQAPWIKILLGQTIPSDYFPHKIPHTPPSQERQYLVVTLNCYAAPVTIEHNVIQRLRIGEVDARDELLQSVECRMTLCALCSRYGIFSLE